MAKKKAVTSHDQEQAPRTVTRKKRARYQQFLKTMLTESDRGALLVGLAEIDFLLGRLIYRNLTIWGSPKDAKWLLDPRAGNRPMGTLAVRTRFARAMGMINIETRNVIDALRAIRNTHAHGTTSFKLQRKDLSRVWQEFRINKAMVQAMAKDDRLVDWGNASPARRELMSSISIVHFGLHFALDDLEHRLRVIRRKGINGDVEGDHSRVKRKPAP